MVQTGQAEMAWSPFLTAVAKVVDEGTDSAPAFTQPTFRLAGRTGAREKKRGGADLEVVSVIITDERHLTSSRWDPDAAGHDWWSEKLAVSHHPPCGERGIGRPPACPSSLAA